MMDNSGLRTASQRTKAVVRVLAVCLSASSIISIIKIVYGNLTGSLAFIADGLHSMFDSGSTIIGILTITQSDKPPDREHPYGHRKFETMSALMLAVLLLVASWEVGKAAVERMAQPDVIPIFSMWGVAILVLTMIINLSLAYYEHRAAKRLRSPFLTADSFHNRADFVITCGVMASMFGVKYRIPFLDSIASLGIAAYLVFLAAIVIRRNLKPLIDARVLDEKDVRAAASEVEGVLKCHNIRSRGESDHHFLDLHIHLPNDMSLQRAHEITHQVEALLKDRFPGLVDVVIHTEPEDHPPCEDLARY